MRQGCRARPRHHSSHATNFPALLGIVWDRGFCLVGNTCTSSTILGMLPGMLYQVMCCSVHSRRSRNKHPNLSACRPFPLPPLQSARKAPAYLHINSRVAASFTSNSPQRDFWQPTTRADLNRQNARRRSNSGVSLRPVAENRRKNLRSAGWPPAIILN